MPSMTLNANRVARGDERDGSALPEESLLRLVAEGTASLTGEAFFYSLTAHLAAALGARYVFVSEFIEPDTRVRTLAFLVGDQFIDNFEYNIAGTVCEQVLRGEVLHFPSGIGALFPRDRLVTELGADSFLAVPLLSASGEVLGHLAAADVRAMTGGSRDMGVLRIFAARAAAELERQRVEASLRNVNQELARTLQSLKATQTQLIHSGKMASLGSLAAGLAHEINSPIGASWAVADVIETCVTRIETELRKSHRDEINPEVLRLLERIRESAGVTRMAAERVDKIVKALKKFARLDEAAYQEADLQEALENTLLLLNFELNERIEVVRKYGQLAKVRCYPNELNQVFMNVLLNAIQAIEGRGTITIETFMNGGHACIRILDTGKGIPPENMGKVFEPGFTTKGVGVGTGLGLPISHNIVKKHRGEMTVESSPRAGTTITITLPVESTG